jgi:hypothetical protein
MANMTYDVHTNLNPEQLTDVAIETYKMWLNFALGKDSLNGRTLKHPSGRYAAAVSWKRTGVASIAIIADESVPETGWIEYGRDGADMKAAQLGKGNTKVSKYGYLYRTLHLRQGSSPEDLAAFVPVELPADAIVSDSSGGGIRASVAKIWSTPRPMVDGDRFVTMTSRPNSRPWIIKPMGAYAPAQALANLIQQQHGR